MTQRYAKRLNMSIVGLALAAGQRYHAGRGAGAGRQPSDPPRAK